MFCKVVKPLVVALASIGSHAVAVPLEYRITGTAEYWEGPDTVLDGALIEFVATIDSEAEPIRGEDPIIAVYEFDVGSPTLTITGSDGADGVYRSLVTYELLITNQDTSWYDAITIHPALRSVPPAFIIPNVEVNSFGFQMPDITGTAIDSLEVPTFLDLDAFSGRTASLSHDADVGGYLAYTITNPDLSITVIPEPSTLVLIGIGIALARFGRGHRS